MVLNLIDSLDHMNLGRALDEIERELLAYILRSTGDDKALLDGDRLQLAKI